MPTFRPDKQHITMADGTIFQAACYSPDYDWSQHVSDEIKAELGEVPSDYDWTKHVTIEERDRVRLLCCEQACADHLEYAKKQGDVLPQKLVKFIDHCKTHEGEACQYAKVDNES